MAVDPIPHTGALQTPLDEFAFVEHRRHHPKAFRHFFFYPLRFLPHIIVAVSIPQLHALIMVGWPVA
jgi:hypothetical protein